RRPRHVLVVAREERPPGCVRTGGMAFGHHGSGGRLRGRSAGICGEAKGETSLLFVAFGLGAVARRAWPENVARRATNWTVANVLRAHPDRVAIVASIKELQPEVSNRAIADAL